MGANSEREIDWEIARLSGGLSTARRSTPAHQGSLRPCDWDLEEAEEGPLSERGEVLARWHEFVGTGEFFRALEQKVSWLRDRLMATIRGEPPGAGNLKIAVESGLESLLREEATAAAERASRKNRRRSSVLPARFKSFSATVRRRIVSSAA